MLTVLNVLSMLNRRRWRWGMMGSFSNVSGFATGPLEEVAVAFSSRPRGWSAVFSFLRRWLGCRLMVADRQAAFP
jgi:hypothetical protein